MKKYKFKVYTNKSGSFIIPSDKFTCKKVKHVWEIEGPIEICNKKIKLPRTLTKMEELDKIIEHLVIEVQDGEKEENRN